MAGRTQVLQNSGLGLSDVTLWSTQTPGMGQIRSITIANSSAGVTVYAYLGSTASGSPVVTCAPGCNVTLPVQGNNAVTFEFIGTGSDGYFTLHIDDNPLAASGFQASTTPVVGTKTVVFILSGSTYTIPSDFISLVSIEALGAGANGPQTDKQPWTNYGGPGGSYAKIVSLPGIAGGSTYNIQVGAPSQSGLSAADTWFDSETTLCAPGGGSVTVPAGSTIFTGGEEGSPYEGVDSGAGGGGGSAAGPASDGSAGGNASSSSDPGAGGVAPSYTWTQTSDDTTASPGDGGRGGTADEDAVAGSAYGGGAGGSGYEQSFVDGGAGIIILTYIAG